MSPEHLDPDRGVDGRSDLFSLGVTLYKCMSGGRFPFVQPHRLRSEEKLALELYKTFASSAEALPLNAPSCVTGAHGRDAMMELIAKALRKSLAERYSSASEMKAHVEHIERYPSHPLTLSPYPSP